MTMNEKDKIDVVQRNVESLRKEMNSRIESDLKFGQVLVAGFAAIIVFKGNIRNYLPVAPVLTLLLVLIWQQSEFSLFRLGRHLMLEEERINKLAGVALLDYESALWKERRQWFAKLKRLRLAFYCFAATLAFFLINQLMKSSSLRDRGATE
jgi:hypothetical protein